MTTTLRFDLERCRSKAETIFASYAPAGWRIEVYARSASEVVLRSTGPKKQGSTAFNIDTHHYDDETLLEHVACGAYYLAGTAMAYAAVAKGEGVA